MQRMNINTHNMDCCCCMYCVLNPVPELSGLTALIAHSGPSAATETKEQEALIVLQAA